MRNIPELRILTTGSGLSLDFSPLEIVLRTPRRRDRAPEGVPSRKNRCLSQNVLATGSRLATCRGAQSTYRMDRGGVPPEANRNRTADRVDPRSMLLRLTYAAMLLSADGASAARTARMPMTMLMLVFIGAPFARGVGFDRRRGPSSRNGRRLTGVGAAASACVSGGGRNRSRHCRSDTAAGAVEVMKSTSTSTKRSGASQCG